MEGKHMDKMTKKIIGAFAVIIVVAAAIIGVYALMNRQAEKKAQEEVLPTTEVGKLLAKDLDLKYPETPTEVVKLYWRINRCLYNESLSDSDFEAVLKQLRKLYDEEFLAEEDNSYETMLKNFKKEREKAEDEKQTISSGYVVQENDTIKVKEIDERKCAMVISSALIKVDTKMTKTYEKFMCRRDKKGKWKILGWQQTTADEASEVGVE
jgi:hypothetical protein